MIYIRMYLKIYARNVLYALCVMYIFHMRYILRTSYFIYRTSYIFFTQIRKIRTYMIMIIQVSL